MAVFDPQNHVGSTRGPGRTGIGNFYDDEMTSRSSHYPHCCAGTREGILHNQWSDAAAPPYSQLSGQNEPMHHETAKDRYYSNVHANQEKLASPTDTLTSRDALDGTRKQSTDSAGCARWWRSNPPRPVNNSVLPLECLGDIRAQVDCPACEQHVVTRTKKVSGTNVGIWSGILCVLTSGICACLPCIMSRFKDTEHYCYSCGVRLATYSPRGHTRVWATHQPSRFSQLNGNFEQQPDCRTIGMPEYVPTEPQHFQQQSQMRKYRLYDPLLQHRVESVSNEALPYPSHAVEVEGSPVEYRKNVHWG